MPINRDEMTVELWYNTGFDGVNIPEGPALLAKMPKPRKVTGVFVYQSTDLSTISLDLTYDEAVDCDYMRINLKLGNGLPKYVYYFITGLEMVTEQCARFSLQCDFWTTSNALQYGERISGWTTRAHVAKKNDTLFNNILSENFQPQQDLVLDGQKSFMSGEDENNESWSYVGANVDLMNIEKIADEYRAANTSVSVPKLTPFNYETVVTMDLPVQGYKDSKIPNTAMYLLTPVDDSEDEAIRINQLFDGIASVRSLGVESAISYSYNIPKQWVETIILSNATESEKVIERIDGVNEEIPTEIPYVYNNSVRNKKVMALFNDYNLISVCSGDKITTSAHLIKEGSNSPTLQMYSDVSPDGKPFAQFKYLNSFRQLPFANCVSGMPWLKSPIIQSGTSGSLLQQTSFNRNMSLETRRSIANTGFNIGNTVLGGLASLVPNPATFNPIGVLQGIAGVGQAALNEHFAGVGRENKQTDFTAEQNIVAPSVSFPQSVTTQNYTGNGFFVYRTRLSDVDTARADDYFDHYGYTQSKPFDLNDLKNRPKFNYIECKDVSFRMKPEDIDNHLVSMRILRGAAQQLMQGVRIWHVRPDESAYKTNF